MHDLASAIVELRPAMLGWAIRRVGDVEADDLVQDACLRAFTIKREPKTSYRGFLFATLHYTYLERGTPDANMVPLEDGVGARDLVGRVIPVSRIVKRLRTE